MRRCSCHQRSKTTANKINKYSCLSSTHHFVPIVIETGGSINIKATEFLSDPDRRISQITMEPLRLHISSRGSQSHCRVETKSHFTTLSILILIPRNYNFYRSAPFRRNKSQTTSLISSLRLCARGRKKIKIIIII